MISAVIVLLSWTQKRSTSHIRSSYIKQHRSLLCLLVLFWAAPIWTNILILKGDMSSELFDIVNKVAFFCIIGSSGVMNLIRMCFDRYLRKKVAVLSSRSSTWSFFEISKKKQKIQSIAKQQTKSGICLLQVQCENFKANK